MTLRSFAMNALLGCSAVLITACSEDPVVAPPEEFIATQADFAGFTSWTQTEEPRVGLDPMAILAGGAHDATDSTAKRWMYLKQAGAVRGSNGQFPIGTILMKQSKSENGDVRMTLAMAKRGNGFNSAGKDWEWFVLNPDGSIMDRGAGLMGGMCNACHSGAPDMAYTLP